MRTYLEKAIKDLPPGIPTGQEGVTDYTHFLPEELRNKGYEIKAVEYVDTGIPVINIGATHKLRNSDKKWQAGMVSGAIAPPYVRPMIGEVNQDHRRQGLGLAMYEALLAHANKVHGLTRVKGGKHSSMVHELHVKLAEKHGMSYEADPNVHEYGDMYGWRHAPNTSFDDKYLPYSETIKSEAPKPVIPGRYRVKYAYNPSGHVELEQYEEAATEQMGYMEVLNKHLNAASRMLGRPLSVNLKKAVALFEENDSDLVATALEAFNANTPENAEKLPLFLNDTELLKEENPLSVKSYKITPVLSEAVETADAIQRGIDAGYINPVKLNGKHSKGAMIVKDPQTKIIYLLKPGSGKNSPAKGVSEDVSSQSEREAGFWHVAKLLGISDSFPRADLILVDGHQTAALELLPWNFHNLGEKKKQDAGLPPRLLEPYRQNGVLFKWAFIDYILGNPDRHSQNIMVDADNKIVRLIDHGSALAGPSFSPSDDTNSFIPFYLRAWTGRKFSKMTPSERIHYMPSIGARAEQLLEEWIKDLDEHHIAEILKDYHINPRPAMERIAKVRAMPGPKWLALNKLWAGAA